MSNRAEIRQFCLFLENVAADFAISGHFSVYSGAVMATFKRAKRPTNFLTVEEVASIFADRKSVDILSEVSSCTSADDSFWESSAADSASEQESDLETEFSGSVPPEFHSDSVECSDGFNCDGSDLPSPKKVKVDESDEESDDDDSDDDESDENSQNGGSSR